LETPIRRLDGISYWVIEDPDAIYDFVNTELRREWEEDARSEGRDPKQDAWLKALPERRWILERINVDQIKLDPRIMDYTDVDREYIFKESLSKRSQELMETIDRFANVIWPVIVKKEDFMLVDGYCHHTTLKALHVSGTYAYVGSL
jgi:hypothetical protein